MACTQKKGPSDLGGQRGRMIKVPDRQKAIQLIKEAITNGARESLAWSLPPSQFVTRLADQGIYLASESTFYRVMKDKDMQHHRGRSKKPAAPLAYRLQEAVLE